MALTQQVQRVTLNGAATPVNFAYPCGKYLVKNYSSGDIYVSFESTCNPATSIRIVSGYGQVCEINERGGAAVPAHINRGNNGLLNVLGFLPPGLEIAAVEVTREIPCRADVSNLRVLHSSDAHRLEDISEADFSLEVPPKASEVLALFRALGA